MIRQHAKQTLELFMPARDALSVEVGGRTIGENLARAERAGAVLRRTDGRYALPPTPRDGMGVASDRPFILKLGAFRPPCRFLNGFLFRAAYGEAQVPFGCRNCYKVVATPRSFHEMMLVKPMVEASGHTAKTIVEALNPLVDRAYSAVVYVEGLATARGAWQALRQQIDRHPELGPDVGLFIRRGCMNYERRCGPSDRYVIEGRLEPVEAALEDHFVHPRPRPPDARREGATLLRMIAIAAQIGDTSSRRYGGGRAGFPAFVTYDPADGRPIPPAGT